MPKELFEARADRMDGGLNLNTDTNLKYEEISSGMSLRFEHGAGIMTGPGFRATATVQSGKGGEGSIEANRIKNTAWAKVGTKIKYTHDAVNWYDTGVTVTDGEYQGFVQGSNGDILSSNQVDNPLRFAVGILQTAATQAGGVLNVGTVYASKFGSSGTVYANGVGYSYSGNSGGNLTGVTVPAEGIPAGTLVVESSNPATWQEEKGTIMVRFESRMLLAGVKGNEHVIYYSAIEDLANPEFFYDFDGNGAYQKEMPGKITGIIKGVGGGFIIMEKAIHKILGFDPTSGALLTDDISSSYGAYNPKCIVDMDGVVAFMGQKRLIPITLTLDPAAQVAPFLGANFDKNIRPWLETHDDPGDQDSAYLKWDSTLKILKIGAVVNGALETYVHDNQAPGFLPKENRSVGTSFMLNAKSYFIHRDNGKCYEDDIGRTNDGVPISHTVTTGQIQHDKGRKYMKGKYFIYSGWMTQGTLHRLRIYLDGADVASFDEEYSWEDLIDLGKKRSIGLRGIGLSVPGGSAGGVVNVYQFDNDILIRELNGQNFRVEWEVTNDGGFVLWRDWYFSSHPTRRRPQTKQ